MKLNKIKIDKILKNFQKAKILVIGDLILDEFIWGNVERISPEAPVPVVWVKSESFMPGGASNVANNISSLSGKVGMSGVIGDDHHGKLLTNELKRRNVDTAGLVIDANRPTSLKTRIIAHHQQVVRVDREKIDNIEDNLLEQILSFIRQKITDIDGLIIEDYGKGLITPRLLSEIIPLAKRHKKIITVDPKENHFSLYKHVTSLTPNTKEASVGSGIKIHNLDDVDKVGKKLLKDLESDSVLVTLGENGMRLFEKNGKITHIDTAAQEVFDVSGAGDTVIATFTLALCSGASMVEAAILANIAAGIVVGKVGVAVVTREEIQERLKIK